MNEEAMAATLSWFPILFMLVIFYFMLYKPQKKAREEHAKMLNSLQIGARIMTIGGIYGTITEIYTETVKMKIAENVVIEIGRGAVSMVVENATKETKE